MIVFGIVLIIGFAYAGSHLLGDLAPMRSESALPYVLLGIALLVALGFEFVNGFHDTANAVATSFTLIPSSPTLRWCGLDSGTSWV
jgi:PiT family inorganic phosphate transporter